MKKGRNVTIQVVADKAGVSKSTVSRVISDSPDISDKTKEKVFAIMDELNYYPSAIARSLANRMSKNIGLVLPADEDFFINPFFQLSLRAISKTASSRGYDALIVYNEDNEIAPIKRVANANKVDGVILMRSQVKDETVDYLKKKKIPFVLIGKSLDYKDIYSVDTDNIVASIDVTSRLVDQGCKKIAFIGGDKDAVVTIDRYEGYKKVIRENGLLESENLVEENECSVINGSKAMEAILKENKDLDGVVITDALMCAGAIDYIYSSGFIENLRRLKKEGKDKKFIIATFGSLKNRGECNSGAVELLDVDVNCKAIGEASCNKLIDILEGKDAELMDLVEYDIKKSYI
ncbi:LacI family DNA-binding transcriptional regulator [Peptostreptococcus russellii]|uniref:LacI family DNA-binding transcriptional regulator n=1 Tax=Peptostreptococcus russellii TaxID=215200 RepID=UPI00294264F4|nr:LacI family DNA-binding transcriptional regulator [Peptostreptococcus russellii]